MTLYLRLAWRNVWRNKRRTLIVIIAVALGLALMVFYDGLMAGATQDLYGKVVRLLGGNIQIHATGYREKSKRMPLLALPDAEAAAQAANAQPEVIAASRRINTSGMISNREGSFPLTIFGIEPELEAPVGLIAQNIVAGSYLQSNDQDMILLGQAQADRMEVGIGDRITLIGQATHDQMRRRSMTVIGVYDLGLPEYEKHAAYISLMEAQRLFGLRDQATEVVIALQKVGLEDDIVNELQIALPAYEVDSWQVANPEMVQTIEMKSSFMNMFGVIIILIAAIGILNLLLMAVLERTREIGLLGAMGLKPGQILVLFLMEGVMMGLFGALFGIALGLMLIFIVGRVGIDISQFAGISTMTAIMEGRMYPAPAYGLLFNRILTVTIISAIAALYPAREASKRDPADALHYV
jgi:ABC-type lipoprotein release transport system permease subunit